jgi:hypothetical protein
MNCLSINKLNDFKTVIESPVLLTGQISLEEKEIYENMWAISFTERFATKVTKQELLTFIDSLLRARGKQASALGYPATFYMWHDAQAAQLRFNILSGHRTRLPFGSVVELQNSIDSILEEFLNTCTGLIPWTQLEILDPNKHYNDEDDEIVHTTKVFKQFLTPNLRSDTPISK